MNRDFSLLVKPASGDCNLRCSYCFYLDKSAMFGNGARRMSRETLAIMTKRFLSIPMSAHSFGWQGGEPTLMGIDFFRDAVRLQNTHKRAGARVANSLQTNGTLLDDAWGKFLREHNFLVGVSIDGTADVHDARRCHASGKGSHAEVLRGLEILRKHGVEHNVLTLVSASNCDRADEVYDTLKSLGVTFMQFIECVEFDAAGAPQPYALKPGQWGEFLCRIFDRWYAEDTRKISIRLFDSVMSRLLTGAPTMCAMNGTCCNYLVVENNGDVFPCDFFVRPELKLGNVNDAELCDIFASQTYRDWGAQKDPRSQQCYACRFLPLCMGDCPKNRNAGKSFLCDDWQLFYSHTIERFEKLCEIFKT